MKILIVDDEPQIRTLLRVTLARAGYAVVEAENARAALSAKAIDKPDLVLLDLGLPDRDGLELVAALKAGPAALIVLSAREETDQKVAALDLGADDYVTKPFDTDELLARVRAALRPRPAGPERLRVEIGDVAIDLDRRIVTRGAKEVHLTPKEYAVLALLAGHPGRVITHGQLLRTAWGPAQEGQTEYLRVVMRALRQKLERVPSSPELLINEPGVGYRLRADRD
jgi:two-component system, OmpR family, KDP operon response regulator KdpE